MIKANISLKRYDGDFEIWEGFILNPFWGTVKMFPFKELAYVLVHLPSGGVMVGWSMILDTAEEIAAGVLNFSVDWNITDPQEVGMSVSTTGDISAFVKAYIDAGELAEW